MAKKRNSRYNKADKEEAAPMPVETIRAQPRDVKGELIDTTPQDLEEYNGRYKHAAHKETFGLKVVEEDDPNYPLGHTHVLKNKDHTWSGTAKEFKEAFEKK